MPQRLLIFATILVLALAGSDAYAQNSGPVPQPAATQPPIARQLLQQVPFPDQYNVVQAYVTIAPGAFVPWHTHPGVEVGYILDGNVTLMVQGQADRPAKAGDSFVNPPDVPHALQNGSTVAHILSVYVVDKTKPLASPAQAPK
jgi:quercetin dioxygenase-like cupin family protein